LQSAIGLAALTVLELPPPEQVMVAAQAGYDCVGLRLIPVPGQVLPLFDERETALRLADTGLRVLDVEVFRLEQGTDVRVFEPAVAAAARLGATQLLTHGADAEEARLAELLGRFCELAARYGLAANIEPMPWVATSTVAQAKRLVAACGRANAAVLVDPIHFFRADNRFEDLAGARMNYLQFCDAAGPRPDDERELIRQARQDRRLPGEGDLDLAGLLRALPAGLPMTLEIPLARPMAPLERARRALEATRRFLSGAS